MSVLTSILRSGKRLIVNECDSVTAGERVASQTERVSVNGVNEIEKSETAEWSGRHLLASRRRAPGAGRACVDTRQPPRYASEGWLEHEQVVPAAFIIHRAPLRFSAPHSPELITKFV